VCKSLPGRTPRFTRSHCALECPVQRVVRVHSVHGLSGCVCQSWHTLGTTGAWSSGVRSRLRGGLAFSLPGRTIHLLVELRELEPQHLPAEMAPELRRSRICVGELRDVTVLAAPGRNRWVVSYVPGVLLHARRSKRAGQPGSGVLPVSPRRTSHDRDERSAPSTVGVWLTFQPARNPRLMAARRADARNRAFR
jgi:hypothetical protein